MLTPSQYKIVVELMHKGDLHHYLATLRPKYVNYLVLPPVYYDHSVSIFIALINQFLASSVRCY